MNDERWAEDTVRMGQHGLPTASEMNSGFAGRRPPLPSRRTVVEIAVGLVAVVALLGVKDGGDPKSPAVGAKHPVSPMANTPEKHAAPRRDHGVKAKPISSNRRRKYDGGADRLRHPRPSPSAHPRLQPAPTPAPVEAPEESAIYPESTSPPPPASREASPPTSPGAEFGM
jgi:hypothetical protein